ncbi:hypothetical protein DOTSEDRAFT_71068 [Dothistroma septosporum NZE10]|uniref:UBC core domain-containing protein n=1 Tax=Dothistroma septosporum (strain NZE10 / CBS 128990) TaxID=675120 RepID=N1PS97_DOTSN|nr:hypothetical protein DOTSEDRAFT_71068 [Dothistroma septosporum NZE10]
MANSISLQTRLLQDIREIQEKPYPGIAVHLQDDQLTKACLVLLPQNEPPLHLTIHFTAQYPLDPPIIKIESAVTHPNVFNDYICINILNDHEAYTPAYSLKGICIQMLSFFASDHVDQMYGENGCVVDRKQWQARGSKNDPFGRCEGEDDFKCDKCGFGHANHANMERFQNGSTHAGLENTVMTGVEPDVTSNEAWQKKEQKLFLVDLPQEVILLFCDHLDEEALLSAARAWNGFGRVMRLYNIMRTRELQCFAFKQGFKALDLGIGVTINHTARGRHIASEFDLLSRLAYERYGVRQSIQGLRFVYWLPLPLSHSHWTRVRGDIDQRLDAIARANTIQGTLDKVINAFMNDIVIRLSHSAEEFEQRSIRLSGDEAPKSTLTPVGKGHRELLPPLPPSRLPSFRPYSHRHSCE